MAQNIMQKAHPEQAVKTALRPSLFFRIFMVSLTCFSLIGTMSSSAQARDSFADLAEQLLPTVVNISTTQKVEQRATPQLPTLPKGSPFEKFFEEFMDRRDQQLPSTPPSSLGSGVIIDAEKGYIVTNNHVIADADEVKITLSDDTVIPAKIIGRDEKTDLAVLKVDPSKGDLRAAKFGDSDAMRVGDWIIAIGNPFGLGGTVTAGIISARQRDINSGPYDDYIQTDASINRGNSGGPMFNTQGEIIGINTAIYSPSGGSVGIGFAIPASMAQPILAQLIKHGKTRRGWLGVRIQTVTEEIAESLGLPKVTGALIASATKSGPAAKAGIKAGDVILSFDGQEISAMRGLPRVVADTEIDKTVDVVVWRDGKKQTLKAKVGELEKAEESGLLNNDTVVAEEGDARGYKLNRLGMTAAALNDALRSEFELPGGFEGVVITSVDNDSDAAQKGLKPGDVILEVNQNGVTTPKAINKFAENARRSGRSSVLLLVSRDGDVRFVAVRFSAQ